jgi:putative tryptophan/tyrosine transport system substrate-binding protein
VKRREFITLLGGAAAAWPLAARAQQPAMPVIGLLSSISADAHPLAAFHLGLAEQGYVENHNVAIEYRFAEGRYDRLPALASELVSRPVDIIAAVGSSPAALAAKSATRRIPIVFFLGIDVVKLGLVASYNRPGGNATGVSMIVTSLTPKRLELLDKLLPKFAPIGLLINPANKVADEESKLAQEAARALGRDLILIGAATAGEIETAFDTLTEQRVGGLAVWQEAFLESRRDQLVAMALRHRLPMVGPIRRFTEVGALMSYGAKIAEAYRQVGIYVGRILRGQSPAELPVLQPTTYELVINIKTAKMLGLEIPPTLLAIADEVIE